MPRPDQPASFHPAPKENQPTLQETLERAKQSQRELEEIRAQSDAIAALAETLGRVASEDKDPARA